MDRTRKFFFYILILFILNQQVDVSKYILFDNGRVISYFWSLTAIVIDVIFLAISWEILGKIKMLPTLIKIFLISFSVYALDSFIYVTGVYINQPNYLQILQGGLTVRLILAIFISIFSTFYLSTLGFKEETRKKPKNYWDIVNLKSDLEIEIKTIKEDLEEHKRLEEQLQNLHEVYQLVIEGSSAGIWDWPMHQDLQFWSPKFYELLGYQDKEIEASYTGFIKLVHPDDVEKTKAALDKCYKEKVIYKVEYRLLTKSGEYRWYLGSGRAKYDETGKPVRIAGSIIDIHDSKTAALEVQGKIDELNKLNKFMVDRELAMRELKKKLGDNQKSV